MGTTQNYSAMERSELEALRAQKLESMRSIQKEIRKLKKKFKSGSYDRQVICEYIIGFQNQMTGLIATLDGINRVLDQKLATAQS